MNPAAPVISIRFTKLSLDQTDLTIIAQQQAEGGGTAVVADDLDTAADEAILDPLAGVHDPAVLQHDAVLDLGVFDLRPVADAGVRADERVLDAAAAADDRGAADRSVDQPGSLPDPDAPDHARCLIHAAVVLRLDLVQDDPVRLEHIILLAG